MKISLIVSLCVAFTVVAAEFPGPMETAGSSVSGLPSSNNYASPDVTNNGMPPSGDTMDGSAPPLKPVKRARDGIENQEGGRRHHHHHHHGHHGHHRHHRNHENRGEQNNFSDRPSSKPDTSAFRQKQRNSMPLGSADSQAPMASQFSTGADAQGNSMPVGSAEGMAPSANQFATASMAADAQGNSMSLGSADAQAAPASQFQSASSGAPDSMQAL